MGFCQWENELEIEITGWDDGKNFREQGVKEAST